MIDDLLNDVRYSLRTLTRSPGFTAVAVLTLAIGIGASTTVFNVANWTLLRPVPGTAEPDRLARIALNLQSVSGSTMTAAHSILMDLRTHAETLTDLAGARDLRLNYARDGADAPRRVDGAVVTANFFDVLGVRPALGRTFAEDEGDIASEATVAVISRRLWRRDFGGDPDVIGRTVTLNGQPVIVVGVAPAGFLGDQLPGGTDIWVPAGAHRPITSASGEPTYRRTIGRLAPGVDPARAEADLERVRRSLEEVHASVQGWRASVTPGLGLPRGAQSSVRQSVGILAGVVALLLLLTCANVANLLLARASRRRRELAVRQAMGAGRRRLVRLFLTESLLLALAGTAVALLAAAWIGGLLDNVQIVRNAAALGDVRPDGRVFGFAMLAAFAATAVFGTAPAFAAARQDPVRGLKDGSRGSSRRPLVRHGLVVAQIAISLALVVGAGLLARTVQGMRAEDLGYRTDRLLAVSVDVGSHGYSEAQTRAFQNTLLERIRSTPVVRSAGIVSVPLMGTASTPYTQIPRLGQAADEQPVWAQQYRVSPDFFSTIELPTVEGRSLAEAGVSPTGDAPRVTVISESLAREIFPDGGAVGRQLEMQGYAEPFEVIAVVADARTTDPEYDPAPVQYLPLNLRVGRFSTPGQFTLYLRTTAEPTAAIATVREAVRGLDAAVPIYDVHTVEDQIEMAITDHRLVASLSSIFAVLATLLAAVGLYGVMTYLVSERTREFGIRTALGAHTRNVLGLVMRQAVAVAAVGLGIGFIGATQLTRLIESRLYGVTRLDPTTFALAAAVLAAAVLVASWVPARRATRVDPMVALRED